MNDRARRIGRNEAVFREINEQVEGVNRHLAELSDDRMHVVCECGDLACIERIVVPVAKYEEIRADATLFVVKPGHDKPELEDVVEHAAGYDVVRKQSGEVQRIAEQTDPRF
ncbi:MAG: hypothetical protein ACJ757_02120 [Gaiellaceae bacterium]